MRCVAFLAHALLLACSGAQAAPIESDLNAIRASDSLLVVAPHPDDESLCCAGLIDLARRAGAHVAIVWVTGGDGSRTDAMIVGRAIRPGPTGYRTVAQRRTEQARLAAHILDVSPDAQFFLGYPDRGIHALVNRHYASPWRSPRTREAAVFLKNAVTPGAAYEGQNLERDLAWIVEQVRPTWILAPSLDDAHPDHHGTALLVIRVMARRQELDRVRYWMVHGGRGWPSPRTFRPDLSQHPPPRGRCMRWESVSLDADAIDAKRRAIEAHWSQTRIMGRILKSYARATELYSRAPHSSATDMSATANPTLRKLLMRC